tara:strand:+ start:1173 stop:1901 length:729 start_codon:yes stop_codon:yes gene_type:complete
MSILHQFRGPGGGFGLQSYNRARAAGINPIHIANAIGSSGMSLGWRARDAIIRDSAAQAFQLKDQRNEAREASDDYKSQIDDLKRSISDYENRVSGLTSQYNQALTTAQENAAARDEFENKFKDATTQFEAAQAEAQRYREEAVGQQLRAVRSGSTAGGANQTGQMRGSLASGRTGYSSDDGTISDLAESMKSQGGLTDSVLSREGPVVEQLSGGSRRATDGNQRKVISSAGTGSYYASRFR